MDEEKFWQLIARSKKRKADCEAQAERLVSLLARLSPADIRKFEIIFHHQRNKAYRWDLWGVAYILNGGCSNDCFDYFSAWLIGQGRQIYEAALAAPETIAPLISEDAEFVECEPLLHATYEAYEQVTGSEMPANLLAFSDTPAGEEWDEDDLARRFPITYARFRHKFGD